MPDYSAPDAVPDFARASTPAATPQATVTVQLDSDVLAWFQNNQPQGMTWQQDINSVLRSYRDGMEAMERDAPLPGLQSDFIPF